MAEDKKLDETPRVIRLAVDPRAQVLYVRFWFIVDLLTAIVIVAFWAAVLFGVARLIGVLRPLAPNFIQTASGVVGVLLAGIAAFALRLWLRRIYGMAEVLFALVVAWAALSTADQLSTFQVLIAVVSAVYLVVRGLDNWLQGVEARDSAKT